MRAQQWMWRALVLIALLNSGGIGYWSCCGQICSVSFWLQVCTDGCPPATAAPEPVQHSSQAAFASIHCDCQFVPLDTSLPLSVKPLIAVQLSDNLLPLDRWAVDLPLHTAFILTTPISLLPHLWNTPHGRRAPPSV